MGVTMAHKRLSTRRGWGTGMAALALLLLFVPGCTPPPAKVAGTWSGLLTLSEGDLYAGVTSPIGLSLTQDEATLGGEVALEIAGAGFPLDITGGRVTANSIVIQAAGVTPGYGDHVTLELEGRVSGDRISGTGTEMINGAAHHFSWEVDRT